MQFIMPQAPRPKWSHFGWLLMLIVAVNCGCSGINMSKSVSPLDFLLPGLHLQNEPPRPLVPASTNLLVCWDDGAPSAANR
jgi:hypothetical protein